jgi:DNA-binding response OmpR family regulator
VSRILVVDDDPATRRLLNRALEADCHDVEEAATGAQAVAASRSGTFDLIVLDLVLPDMSGIHVLETLLAERPDSRVIVISAVHLVDARVDVLETGALDFIAKPFALAELLARVRVRLRRSSASRAGRPARPAWRRPELELTGAAVDLLREAPGTVAVDAALDQAEARVAEGTGGELDTALSHVLHQARICQRAGSPTSTALETALRNVARCAAETPRFE